MTTINCLIVSVILFATYGLFTMNYPKYQTDNITYDCTNDFIKYLSLINHCFFLGGNIILLVMMNLSTIEQFKKIVFVPCAILQIIYLWLAIFIINNAICSTYLHLSNYYSFVNSFFWLSVYGLYLRLALYYLIE